MSEARKELYEEAGKVLGAAPEAEIERAIAIAAAYRAGLTAGRELEKKQKPGAEISAQENEQIAG